MRVDKLIRETLELQGFRVGKVTGGAGSGIEVLIVPDRRYSPRCGDCGNRSVFRDHRRTRRYRHVPFWGIPVTLIYTIRRVRCERCGLRVERVPWADGRVRMTRALAATMAAWARTLPWSHVAKMFGVSWPTVEKAVKAAVEYGRARQDLSGLTHIGVDEISRRKGHVYHTVVYDLKTRRLVWCGEGRTRATMEKFFDFLGKEGSARLEAVCCDMWRAYVSAVKARAENAVVVFDKFHIVGHLTAAVDEVRRDEMRDGGGEHRDLLKGTRYIWLKNPWNLTGGQAAKLAQIERLNTRVHRAYLLKEGFRRFWNYKRPAWARKYLEMWCSWARGTGLSPLRSFANTMLRHADDILNYFRARIDNGAVEGLNNKAKVAVRRAYGYRTSASFSTALYHCLGDLPLPATLHPYA